MTLSQIRKSFSQEHNFNPCSFPKLEITKKSQIWSDMLTPRHHLSYHPVQKNPKLHLNPGDKLTLLGFNQNQIIVQIFSWNSSNQHPVFTISYSYIKKYTKVL